MRKHVSLFLALMLLTILLMPSALAEKTMYVNTANQKELNLRKAPAANARILIKIPYASEVLVYDIMGSSHGWTAIEYGSYRGYVMSRYLSPLQPYVNPEPVVASNVDVKTLFHGFELVEPYAAVASPLGSFVNLRWAPTKQAGVILKCVYGDPLTVIAQGKTWAQVTNQETGAVGFMMLSFIKPVSAQATK